MKRSFFVLLICFVFIANMIVPAFAVMPRANNVTETIYHNGKTYTASYSLNFSISAGGWGTAQSGGAYIPVTLSGVSVTFDTLHDGYVTLTGVTKSGAFDKKVSKINSNYTTYYVAPEEVLGYKYISGSAIFHGDDDYTVSAYMY